VDNQKKADHETMKHTHLAVAFEAHFKRPISQQCITQVGDHLYFTFISAIIFMLFEK